MASRSTPGRNQSWISTPAGCFCKALIHMIYHEKYFKDGLRGRNLRDDTVKKFERLVPYHNQYWARPRTVASIFGRGFTTNNSHHALRENAHDNPHTAPYCSHVGRLLEWNQPWPKEELDRRLAEVVAFLEVRTPKRKRREIPPSVRRVHRDFLGSIGDRCPYCAKVAEVFQYDHWHDNQHPDLAHTWPLCVPCHKLFTGGHQSRTGLNYGVFQGYQAQLMLWVQGKKEAAE